jgi:heme-degrading monooxygenase HmoA
MYATIRSYSGGGEFADALVAHEDEVRRIISEIEGFRAYYLLRTPEGTTTVSVFATEEGAQESTSKAAAWIAENVPEVSPGAPQVTSGRVAVSF